jgi:hypothetical protein
LRAIEFFGRAGKAALAGNGKENFELGKFHKSRSQVLGFRKLGGPVRAGFLRPETLYLHKLRL